MHDIPRRRCHIEVEVCQQDLVLLGLTVRRTGPGTEGGSSQFLQRLPLLSLPCHSRSPIERSGLKRANSCLCCWTSWVWTASEVPGQPQVPLAYPRGPRSEQPCPECVTAVFGVERTVSLGAPSRRLARRWQPRALLGRAVPGLWQTDVMGISEVLQVPEQARGRGGRRDCITGSTQ